VCASKSECQAVQLNIASNVCVQSCNKKKESAKSDRHVKSSVDCDTVCGKANSHIQCHCSFCQYSSSDVNSDCSSRNGSAITPSTIDQLIGISCGVGSTPSDEFVGCLDNSDVHCRIFSPLLRQAVLHEEFICCDLGLSQKTNNCDELFVGPVNGSQSPCPVSVEFEGISHLSL